MGSRSGGSGASMKSRMPRRSESTMPEMKKDSDLSPEDFVRHPVWVGVHGFDSDEPWYENSDEETFRPWLGPLPFNETRGVALIVATMELADGSLSSGFCRAVRDDWDSP